MKIAQDSFTISVNDCDYRVQCSRRTRCFHHINIIFRLQRDCKSCLGMAYASSYVPQIRKLSLVVHVIGMFVPGRYTDAHALQVLLK
jgi:hypothetical protein